MDGDVQLPMVNPTAVEVIERLLDEIDGATGELERLSIEAGAPTEYVCRLYWRGDPDYEGFVLSF